MERVRIEGERVTLRPLVLDELDASIAARVSGDPTAHPVKPDREQLKARFERSGLMQDGAIDLAIDVGGTRIGEIQTYVPPERELPAGAYEVGIFIDDPNVRGRGYGSEAVSLFLDWLFDERGATRGAHADGRDQHCDAHGARAPRLLARRHRARHGARVVVLRRHARRVASTPPKPMSTTPVT